MKQEEIKKCRRNPIAVSKLREILNRAVVDAQFRKQLFENPIRLVERFDLSEEERVSVLVNLDDRMLRFIESIDDKISLLSESVLCTNGPCGIA